MATDGVIEFHPRLQPAARILVDIAGLLRCGDHAGGVIDPGVKKLCAHRDAHRLPAAPKAPPASPNGLIAMPPLRCDVDGEQRPLSRRVRAAYRLRSIFAGGGSRMPAGVSPHNGAAGATRDTLSRRLEEWNRHDQFSDSGARTGTIPCACQTAGLSAQAIEPDGSAGFGGISAGPHARCARRWQVGDSMALEVA